MKDTRIQAQIEERFAQIETATEDDGLSDEAHENSKPSWKTCVAQYAAIENRPRELDAETRGKIGSFLTLTAKGELVLDNNVL